MQKVIKIFDQETKSQVSPFKSIKKEIPDFKLPAPAVRTDK